MHQKPKKNFGGGRQMKIKTTVSITHSTKILQNEILKHMDIPKTVFHQRAIKYFLDQNLPVHPWLLVKDRDDLNYVNKNDSEQMYIEEELVKQLKEISDEYNCGWTTVVFQALMTYCAIMAKEVLGEDALKKKVK